MKRENQYVPKGKRWERKKKKKGKKKKGHDGN